MTLIEWLREQLDADERVRWEFHHLDCVATAEANANEIPDRRDCDCGYPARVLAEVKAKRAILDLHRQIECVNCEAQGRKPATSCLRCHHGDSDLGERYYDGTCSTVRALAQSHTGRPGWLDEWSGEGTS